MESNSTGMNEKLEELTIMFDTKEAKLNATQEKFDQSRKRADEYQDDLRKVQTETDHSNELGHQKDVQIKFLHEFYVKRRENLEISRRMYALLLDKKASLKKELAALENEPEKLAKKFETLMARQNDEHTKQESIYDSIEWAKNFKVKYAKNVSLKEHLDEAKHQLTVENNKLNDYENELLAMSRNELPWPSVCIQFAEHMLKNMQMKKEIYENEMKIADYRRSKEKAPILEKAARKAQETTPVMEKISSKTSMETPMKSISKHVETIEIDVDREHGSAQKQTNSAQNILKALNNAVSLTPPTMVSNQAKKPSPEIEIASPKRPLTDFLQNRCKDTPRKSAHYPDEPALKRAKAGDSEGEIMVAPKVTAMPKKSVVPIESTPLETNESQDDLNSAHHTTFGFDLSASSNPKQGIPESSPNDFLRTLFNQSDESGKAGEKESFFNPFVGDQLSNTEPENGSGQAPNGFDFFGTLGGGQDNGMPDNGFTFSFNMNAADNDSHNGQSQAAGGFPMFNF